MLVWLGVTTIATNVGAALACTVILAVAKRVALTAVIVALPWASPVATPDEFTEAVCRGTTNHVVELVRLLVLPSVYVPTTWNCSTPPSAIVELLGFSASETRTGALTVTFADAFIAPKLAWMVPVPSETAFTTPVVLTAAEAEEEVQITVDVRSCVLPSEYAPVALNC
jgi:hypothetical protein